ncbi:hypothetical protein CALCODRAFT_437835 [Calocera cornea HHB12733]|uniref:Capsular associated protein n=1 Tax=Calocera cornea HHB12733 TaxID=1353952 RepID=A0A165EJM1_9BASI|nr:hypothetical protein CALCODRAFT_437835 [Calocera cornea HHB12733]
MGSSDKSPTLIPAKLATPGSGGPGGGGAGGGGPAQRVLGLPPRVWAILGLLSFILFLSRLIFPASPIHPLAQTTPFPLKPRDYLNASATSPPPFDFCPIFGPGDAIAAKYGAHALMRSRAYLGSGARIQRLLRRALEGRPITISVLGGSVSACHGAGDDPISPRCYPSRFFQWWTSVFPHPASELTNGAVRRTDTGYFAFCSALHLPDRTDLVILEFDTEDPNDPAWREHFELLVRTIMVRPEQPAVIILGHFAPQMQQMHGFAGAELHHTAVAQYYDIPHISIKGPLYNDYLLNPDLTRQTFYADPILANPTGHELLADILISYMESQACLAWDAAVGRGAYEVPELLNTEGADELYEARGLFGGVGVRVGGSDVKQAGKESGKGPANALSAQEREALLLPFRVPPLRLTARPARIPRLPPEPYCASANDLINPLPPSLFYGSGWHAYHPPTTHVHDLKPGEERHYWHATLPTSRVRIPVRLMEGDVAVWYLREPRGMGSVVSCWVDNNYGGARVLEGEADVNNPVPTLTFIDRSVAAGSHYVECELHGEEGHPVAPFRIMGVFAT